MRNALPKILIWLFVINLGIALGAGLFESRIVFPQWLLTAPDGSGMYWNADAVRETNTGLRFWVFVTTVPLTLLTLANLVAAWKSSGPVRFWWLTAAFLALGDRIFTFSYFIPTMVGLMDSNLAQPDAVARAAMWSNLNLIRHSLVLGAWLASLKTFASMYEQGRSESAGEIRS